MTPPTIHDPIHHVAHAFERDGENLWVQCWFEPEAHLPEHFHPTLEERWEVLEGTLRLKLDGRWRWLTVDDGPVPVASGARHELRNSSGWPVRARAEVLPAGHLEEFLTDAARAARDGVFTARGLPTSLRNAVRIAAFAQRHRHETVMTFPPPALQRIVLPILARFAADSDHTNRKTHID
jgi:mannose-6-phosphate isomerase-like protein (cupin superfamily)